MGRSRTTSGSLLVLVASALLLSCDKKNTTTSVVYFDLLAHRFTAEREFTCYDAENPVSYVERLSSMGDGSRFSLDLLELNGKSRNDITDPAELTQFDQLQSHMNEGGGLRILHQRDFRIEDFDQADRNYRVFPDGKGAQGLTGPRRSGDMAVPYWVIPLVQDRPFYRVTISVESGRVGFPLAYEEYVNTASGPVLVSEMAVRSLDYGNSPSMPARPDPIVSRRDVTLTDAVAQATYPLFFPFALPTGYQLDRIEEVVMSTDASLGRRQKEVTITRILFTDGVDLLEIVQHEPSYGGNLDGVLGAPGSLKRQSSRVVVNQIRFASITIGTAIDDDYQLTIESKIASERFRQVLESLRQLN